MQARPSAGLGERAFVHATGGRGSVRRRNGEASPDPCDDRWLPGSSRHPEVVDQVHGRNRWYTAPDPVLGRPTATVSVVDGSGDIEIRPARRAEPDAIVEHRERSAGWPPGGSDGERQALASLHRPATDDRHLEMGDVELF